MKKTYRNALIILSLALNNASGTQSSHRTTPLPDVNGFEIFLLSAGLLTAFAGDIMKVSGIVKVIGNTNFFTSGEKIADYKKKELAELPKEKLEMLIAKEEERKKNKQNGAKRVLKGFGLNLVGAVAIVGAVLLASQRMPVTPTTATPVE